MPRYLSSFLLTVALYAGMGGALFYLVSKEQKGIKKGDTKASSRMSVVLLNPPKKLIAQPKKKLQENFPEKKVLAKREKRVQPKAKVKKTKPQVHKEPRKEPVLCKNQELEKKIEHETRQEENVLAQKSIETPSNLQQSRPETTAEEKSINKKLKERQREEFIQHLIQKINSNKSYPNMARRRGIEGVLDIKFHILSNGHVKGIEIISGRSIFKKATLQAIQRSFPIKVDSSLFNFPEAFKLKITYTLTKS
jgi:periplasmic protein TonB